MSDVILLTGATGLLGRYLLRDLTLRGARLAVLARGDRRDPPEARVESIMAGWEGALGRRLPRPHVLTGELTKSGLGLDAAALRWIGRHCAGAIHNAASLTFVGADRDGEPWQTNLNGTANLVDVCMAAGVRSFHHVSTAYVCGLRSDLVTEDEPLRAGPFRNDYEHSKAEAERLVRAAAFPGGVTVHRPAVIVGDSVTGYTSTYHGLYLYLQYMDRMRRLAARASAGRGAGRWVLPLRLDLTGDERRNLVPVDWVSAVIAEVVLRPELHGKTYHQTPTPPVTARQLEGAMEAYFNYTGVTFAGPGARSSGDLNAAEAAFYEYVSRYELYWASEPTFDATNTRTALPHLPCPPLDAALLARLIEFAVRDKWGRASRKVRPTAAASTP
ncbi:SDR family oxidoreductase [Paludisphaera soli]|uniref:SDR family oxidoreductase n=1 Tax=Paludisphaera soli TaxID=2712865 RepID=UPI0013EA9061|nr:SDR family oxidoreductase [Paludisphaera soli]